jgi:hypothetical protein
VTGGEDDDAENKDTKKEKAKDLPH